MQKTSRRELLKQTAAGFGNFALAGMLAEEARVREVVLRATIPIFESEIGNRSACELAEAFGERFSGWAIDHRFSWLTSKMSHDGSWRAACSTTIHFR